MILLLALIAALLAGCGGSGTVSTPEPAADSAQESLEGASQNPAPDESPSPKPDGSTADRPTESQEASESAAESAAQPQESVEGTPGLAYHVSYDEVLITGLGTVTETEIVIPSHIEGIEVKGIDENAFQDTGIVSVVLPWTIKKVDEDAFARCLSLKSVTFSEGLEYIGESAFYGCRSLKAVTLPASLISAGSRAFFDCASLGSVTLLGTPEIGNKCFGNCHALKEFTMGPGTEWGYSVGDDAFYECVSLETIRFAEGLHQLGNYALAYTSGLKTVYLPATLEKIGSSAFTSSAVEKVLFGGSREQWTAVQIGSSNDPLSSAAIEYDAKG